MSRLVMLASLMGIASFVFSSASTAEGDATPSSESAWEIQSIASSDEAHTYLYVVKHNRITGETLILSCEDSCKSEQWYKLPAVDKTKL